MPYVKMIRNRTSLLYQAILCFIIACILLLIVGVMGCTSTVTPVEVRGKQASADGNVFNSGVIDQLPDGSFVVTPHWISRYRSMQGTYSNKFTPPLPFDYGVKPYTNGTYLATSEAVGDFGKMNHYRRKELGR